MNDPVCSNCENGFGDRPICETCADEIEASYLNQKARADFAENERDTIDKKLRSRADHIATLRNAIQLLMDAGEAILEDSAAGSALADTWVIAWDAGHSCLAFGETPKATTRSIEDERALADALSYYVDLVNAGKQTIPQEYILRFRESLRAELEILCKTVIVLRDLDIGEQARATRRLGAVRGPLDR
jgi:hypothetical protein